MARIRSIKPSTWTDRHFVACSPLARLLWIGTWNFADDYGVLKDDPVELRYQILPADDCDPHELVDELVSRKMLLRRLTPDGASVLVIRNFCLHQKIDTRSPGRWGHPDMFISHEPDLTSGNEPSPDHSQPFPSDPDPGRDGMGENTCPPAPPLDPFGAGFSECWDLYPRKEARKDALRAYQARRRDGVSHDQLLTATRNYAEVCRREGREKRHVLLGKTFFGPNDRWEDFVTSQAPRPNLGPDRGVA